MKGKLKHRVLAGFMALLMVVGLVPFNFGGISAEAASRTDTYSLDATALDGTGIADKQAVEEGTTFGTSDFFKSIGTVSYRTTSDGKIKALEVGKAISGAVAFTVSGTANVTLGVSSTGGSNISPVALVDASGNVISNAEGLTEVSGTSATTLTYKGLTAGTYRVVSPEDPAQNRGFRLITVTVDDEVEIQPTTVTTEFTFDAKTVNGAGIADKDAAEAGTTFGTSDYFKVDGTVSYRTNSDGSIKALEIGKAETGSFMFTVKGTADATIGVSSTGGSNISPVALVDANGNVVSNEEGLTEVSGTSATTLTYKGLAAGTYKLVSPEDPAQNRGCRVLTANVADTYESESGDTFDWDAVAAPAITDVSVNDGKVTISFDMVIGKDGAGKVTVTMTDADGNVVATKGYASEGTAGSVVFEPSASGTYVFKVTASRAGYADKTSGLGTCVFTLPLGAPSISSATSMGGGKVEVVWSSVDEADSYELYMDGTLVTTTSELSYTVSGLAVGSQHSFTVAAVRGSEKGTASSAASVTVTDEAQVVWGFTRYGSSTDEKNNGYTGNANEGTVTVYSEGGKGKMVPNSTDGLAFYYTAVPTDTNFTLRANVHVDQWTLSNGQEGFGLLATDRLGENGVTSPVWNNQYMVFGGKVEYYYDSSTEDVSTTQSGRKYTMKLGVGVMEKTGVTKDNLDKFEANDTATVQNVFSSVTQTLDLTPAKKELDAGTYNIIGNAKGAVEGQIAEITDFVLEIQKNNTGYFATYYDANGKVIKQIKYYDTEALNKIDSDNVYVGFFASRNARATFSDIKFTTIKASEDAPAEERPITVVTPTFNVTSAKVANTENYTLSMVANVDGTVNVTANGEVIAENLAMQADVRVDIPVILTSKTKNKFIIEFQPDPNYVPGEYMVLENTNKIKINMDVNRNTTFSDRVNLYVAPKGSSMGSGSVDNPLDIYTAVQYVQPGQTIILKEGTYYLDKTVTVPRGVDGTADNMIRMIADPNASSRPVFDFKGMCAGMVLGGNYWYFEGFDVTHSGNALKGIQVSGSHNTLDNIMTYHNGNTGLQISRMYSTDQFADWPSYNLILNCTSYGNADAGYEDADGFAAKLTVGNGNVFDGCLAYNNADDGWDLFAKVETGSIGSVTIQNCIAYGNGYLEDGTNAGNGNGFKMGGDSLSGYHKLINSVSFFNKAKGIDSNSCPDIQVENSISYNNESYNVAFYTNNAKNTDFSATGIVSFKDSSIKSGLTTGEQFKPVGTQDTSKYTRDTNYYWDGTKSVNASGQEFTADMFVTLTFTGITRNADGTLNRHGFLELTDSAPANVGANTNGTASGDVTVNPETAVDDDDDDDSPAQTPVSGEDATTADGTPSGEQPTTDGTASGEQPTTADGSATGAAPETGDAAPVVLLAILAAISGAVVLVSSKKRITE